jgi:hypothetical protein
MGGWFSQPDKTYCDNYLDNAIQRLEKMDFGKDDAKSINSYLKKSSTRREFHRILTDLDAKVIDGGFGRMLRMVFFVVRVDGEYELTFWPDGYCSSIGVTEIRV